MDPNPLKPEPVTPAPTPELPSPSPAVSGAAIMSPAPVVMGGSPSPIPLKPKQRKVILFVLPLLLFILAAVAVLVLYVMPRQKSATYVKDSGLIAKNLRTEVTRLKNNNFTDAKTITTSLEEAKTRLQGHISDLDDTKKEINNLKSEFHKLKTPKNQKAQADAIEKAFGQAESIMTSYGNDLELREKIFAAYDILPNELDVFNDLLSTGGPITEFIAETDLIVSLADESIIRMGLIEVEADDKALYDHRMGYLVDIKTTFTSLTNLYRAYNQPKIKEVLTEFSAKNEARNEAMTEIINNYVDNSSLAKEFEAFDVTIKTVTQK